uniref:Uncharacterized protein n=1 Tax=Rousettus aegyptiacus TaxID=9407 RepID=A0A7J8H0T5_ROUAE|nr:hypothetical protein HJG63_011281 [Rousettus aegyptiacus]
MLMSLRHSLFPSACLTSGSLCDLYWIYVETSKATSVVLDFLSFSCSFMWIFFFSTFFILLLNSQHNVHFYRISDILNFSLLSSVTLVNPQPLQFFLSSPMGCYSKLHLTLFFSQSSPLKRHINPIASTINSMQMNAKYVFLVFFQTQDLQSY